MATVTTFVDGTQTTNHIGTKMVYAENKLDFSATNVSSADVVQALKIPKGAIPLMVDVKMVTAEGATATATVGDGTDPNGYDNDINLNTTGRVCFPTRGTDAYANATSDAEPGLIREPYSADDTIDIVPGADLDTAVLVISCVYAISDTVSKA